MNRRIRRALAALLLLVFGLLLLTIALELYLRLTPRISDEARQTAQRRSGTMPQYAHSPYWSVAFVDAFHAVAQARTRNDDDQWATADVTTIGYTVRNNMRLTTDQPEHWTHTVRLYGSSTVWGAFVADGWTISSYLQREYNRRGIAQRVVNMGQWSVDVAMQNYWLGKSDIHPGDTVIYIDGAVDFRIGVDDANKVWRSSLFPCRIPLAVLSSWCAHNAALIPAATLNEYVTAQYNRYWRGLDEARLLTQSRGATFYHFVQPTMFDNYPGGALSYPELYRQFVRGDQMLTIDRADFFDDKHYDDAAHKTIAQQIAAALVQEF